MCLFKGTALRMASAIFSPRSWKTGFSSHWRALASKWAASSMVAWVVLMAVRRKE